MNQLKNVLHHLKFTNKHLYLNPLVLNIWWEVSTVLSCEEEGGSFSTSTSSFFVGTPKPKMLHP